MADNKEVLFLESLFDAMDEIFSDDEQVLDDSLSAIGIDPHQVESRGRTFIAELQGKARRKHATQKRSVLEEIKARFNFNIDKLSKQEKETVLDSLVSNKQLSLAFRKIENLSDDDLLEILKEQELLKYFSDNTDQDVES